MQNEILFPAILGALLFFVILYYVIRSAVASGIKQTKVDKSISLLSRLKIREMRKSGISDPEIKDDIDQA